MGEFIEEFEKDWGEPPTMAYQAMGWDSVMMVAAAMEEAGSTEGAKVSDALEEIEFEGLSGKTSYTDAEEGHRPIKEAFIDKLENGQPVFLERFVPSYEPEV
jgi:branched-chain amino acid transport system substrate-binding protein